MSEDFDELEDFEDLEEEKSDDLMYAQRLSVKSFIYPRGLAAYTLSDLTDSEVKTLAQLSALADHFEDDVLKSYIRKYLLLKRSRRRLGVKEIISVVGGRAWRLLQNITLPRIKREKVSEEGGEGLV